ncbi:MAG: MarR family transcriptional regulator [Ideonella sp.]|nr:MarR family transcriptional regulator [Ideonella sp.]
MPDRTNDLLHLLYLRPGFLLRRAHQLSVGLFEEGCREVGLTPPQYGVLTIVDKADGCDQATVARALGFDRVTTLRIVRGLEARGLLRRQPSSADSRRLQLMLTSEGQATLARARPLAARVTRQLMAPLAEDEREVFQQLLRKLCAGLEPRARTKLEPPRG